MIVEMMILVTNLMGFLLAYFIMTNYIDKQEITSYSKKIHSFTKSRRWIDFLQHRYVEQLLLSEYIHIKEMLVYYAVFIFIVLSLKFLTEAPNLIVNLLILIVLVLPIAALEQYRKIIDRRIDKGIFQLLTQINARLIKSEDILKAISESEKALSNKPILYLVKQFNQTIKVGLPPELAFEKLQNQSLNEYFCYLFTNINLVYQRRGNVIDLIKALENEYTSIQIEINKRKTELEHDRNMIGLSLLIVFFITYKITIDNDYIITFYKAHNGIGVFWGLFVCLGAIFATIGSVLRY
ncbi:hypothetical protein [Fusibacter bizertensis]